MIAIQIHHPDGTTQPVQHTALAALADVLETVAAQGGEDGLMTFFEGRHPVEDVVIHGDVLTLFLFDPDQVAADGDTYAQVEA